MGPHGLALPSINQRAACADEPFGSFPFALGSDISVPQDHQEREEVTRPHNLCAGGTSGLGST